MNEPKRGKSAKDPVREPPSEAGALELIIGVIVAIPFALTLVGVMLWLIFWGPEVLLTAVGSFLGPRLSASLVGAGLFISGVLLGGRMLYVTSTRGPQGTPAGRLMAVGLIVGLIALGARVMLAPTI